MPIFTKYQSLVINAITALSFSNILFPLASTCPTLSFIAYIIDHFAFQGVSKDSHFVQIIPTRSETERQNSIRHVILTQSTKELGVEKSICHFQSCLWWW